MKTAMFGGSFNPIHIGHIQLAQVFAKKLDIDKVLFIPTFIPPHKQYDTSILPKDRIEMCKLAIKNLSFAQVSDIEIKRGGSSYTYLTLQELSKQYKNDELFLITGADMFMSINTWKHPEIIFKLATICGVPRNNDDINNLKKQAEYLKTLGAKTQILDVDVMTVSSTEIRNKIKNNENTDGLISKEVREYIDKNNLYKE